MNNPKLTILIERIVDEVLKEDRADISADYVASIKSKDPELYNDLMQHAEFVIQATKNKYKPSDKLVTIHRLLNSDPNLDPRSSGDTHGVRLFIDYLAREEGKDSEDSREFAGKAKRWYQSTIDALLKKVFQESTTEKKRKVLSEAVRKPFNMDLPRDLLTLADIFTLNSFQLVVVGGAVRDALLGKEPKDYDVATNAQPDEVLSMLAGHPQFKTLEIGKSFGVINVITPEGNEYEVATYRNDIGSGRRPDAVEFTTIENDVKRRDLTINALFFDIAEQEIIDYVGGIKDLEAGRIRAVGDAKERFDEDPLRILRAIRFSARMGAGLDDNTEEAIRNDNTLRGVSPERVRDEFLKSIKTARSVPALMRLYDSFDLWGQILPGLKINTWYQETKNIPVLLSLLLRENPPKSLGKKMNKLKYSVVETRQIMFLTMFQGLTPENAYQMKKLWKSTRLTDQDLEEFARLSNHPKMQLVKAFNQYTPTVDGQELLAQGFKGRELGQEIERREMDLFKRLI